MSEPVKYIVKKYKPDQSNEDVVLGEMSDKFPYELYPSENIKIGAVIGTYGSVPYVHGQLESLRQYNPKVKYIVSDDCSPQKDQTSLINLCKAYNCECFISETKNGHALGDMLHFYNGLCWAKEQHLDILVKFSRRWIPIFSWEEELRHLAYTYQHHTFSGECLEDGFGFRTECIAMSVKEWSNNNILKQLNDVIVSHNPQLVEAYMHNIAKTIHDFRCIKNRLICDKIDNMKNGFYYWKEMLGTCRTEKNGIKSEVRDKVLWRGWQSPKDYMVKLKELYGFSYTIDEFNV